MVRRSMADPSVKVQFKIGGVTAETGWFRSAFEAQEWAREHVNGEYTLCGVSDEYTPGDN